MNSVGIRIRVSGFVQGVGFRYFASRQAREYGLVGFAENLNDGSVLVEAWGDRTDLESFLSLIARGPRSALVDHIEHQWLESDGSEKKYSAFETR